MAPGRDNLLAWYEAPGARRLILFDVHQDTVPADGMTIPPFVPEIDRGRLSRPGLVRRQGLDGGDAVGLRSAGPRTAAGLGLGAPGLHGRRGVHPHRLVAAGRDEARGRAGDRRRTDLLNLVHCHKGALRWKIRTKGVACHSSTPAPGRECDLPDGRGPRPSREVRRHRWPRRRPTRSSARPRLSVGRIEGGQSVNVVPDWCEIEVDRRLIPGEDAASAMETVKELAEKLFEGPGCVEMSQPWVHMPPLAPRAAGWIEPLSRAIETATARRPRVMGVPFGTDAGPSSEQGTPCVVFGPGDIAQAHTKDEWIDLEQVQLAAAGLLSDRRRARPIGTVERPRFQPAIEHRAAKRRGPGHPRRERTTGAWAEETCQTGPVNSRIVGMYPSWSTDFRRRPGREW